MQMFCQASAPLRCALLQGDGQVLYKPECVFITRLRMAAWRACVPTRASAPQSVRAQNRVSSHPSKGLFLFLPDSVSLFPGPGGLHGHILACRVKPCTKKKTKQTAVASLSASSYPLASPLRYWCWRSVCLRSLGRAACTQTAPGFAWKPSKARGKETLKGEEISGQHRILSGIFLKVFASALTAKVRAPLWLWVVRCGHESSAGKRETLTN